MSFRRQRLGRLRYEFSERLGELINERGFRELHSQFGILDRREFFQYTELFFNRLARDKNRFYPGTATLADVRQVRDVVKEKSEAMITAARMFPDNAGVSSNRAIQVVRLERACLKRCNFVEQDAAYRFAMCWEALSYVCEVEHTPQFRDLLDRVCLGDDVKHIREDVVQIIGCDPVYPFLDLPPVVKRLTEEEEFGDFRPGLFLNTEL